MTLPHGSGPQEKVSYLRNLRFLLRCEFANRDFKIYDADVDENVTSKYNVALS